jgi:hypothetical protein
MPPPVPVTLGTFGTLKGFEHVTAVYLQNNTGDADEFLLKPGFSWVGFIKRRTRQRAMTAADGYRDVAVAAGVTVALALAARQCLVARRAAQEIQQLQVG